MGFKIAKHPVAIVSLVLIGCCLVWSLFLLRNGTTSEPLSPGYVLKLSVLPDEDSILLRAKYGPLVEYLEHFLDLDVHLVVPKDYRDLLTLFGQGAVDLAYFGGYTFVNAREFLGAKPLVMGDVDRRFTSWFLVRADRASSKNISDFEYLRFSFGSQLSTSGHLMPRHFMQTELNIDPDEFFSEVSYSGAHDATLYNIRSGKVDIGVASAETVKKMIQDGRISKDEFHIVWQTPPFTNYVWAVKHDMPKTLEKKLRNAFLDLDQQHAEHSVILSHLQASYFVPAGQSDFTHIQAVSESMALLKWDHL